MKMYRLLVYTIKVSTPQLAEVTEDSSMIGENMNLEISVVEVAPNL
jgi:hypothetical protein